MNTTWKSCLALGCCWIIRDGWEGPSVETAFEQIRLNRFGCIPLPLVLSQVALVELLLPVMDWAIVARSADLVAHIVAREF